MALSTIHIKTKRQIYLLQLFDLQYFFFTEHAIMVKLTNGESIHLDGSLVEKYKNFTHPHFFKIHPSYLVNIKSIGHLIKENSKWSVVMVDGERLPLDDAHWKIFQKRFLIL
ncbi:MAG: LytTR family transcriptional regulator DNA-binding domain-containing protein [Bacteroidota bacterium]